jgi:hypothetical protein
MLPNWAQGWFSLYLNADQILKSPLPVKRGTPFRGGMLHDVKQRGEKTFTGGPWKAEERYTPAPQAPHPFRLRSLS